MGGAGLHSIHSFSGRDLIKTEPVSAADNRSPCDAKTYTTRKGLAAICSRR